MKSQSGVALLVSLVVLVVAILLGLSSFQSSLLEERMAGNHRLSVSALQSAEAGVDEILDTVMSYTYTVGDENTLCDGIDVATYFTLSDSYDFSDDGELEREYMIKLSCDATNNKVVGLSRGYVLNKEGVELSARKIRVLIDPPGWTTIKGMISDQSIVVKGNSEVVGIIHANGNLEIKIPDGDDSGEPEGYVTASGTVTLDNKDVDQAVDGICDTLVCASSGVARVDVKTASDEIAAAFEDVSFSLADFPSEDGAEVYIGNAADSSENDLVVLAHDTTDGSCSVDGSVLDESQVTGSVIDNSSYQVYEHTVFYCPGDLTVEGDFNGVAVMAGGDITHNGSSELGSYPDGEPAVDTFMYAVGQITLNGTSDTYGEFVSDGGFRQNGTSKIYGTIISSGDISANGGIEFEAMETGRIRYLSSGRLDSWDELEDPGLPGPANM